MTFALSHRGNRMTLLTGTWSTQDLISFNQTTVNNYDPQAIADALSADLASHTRIVQEMLTTLVEDTTDRIGTAPVSGTSDRMIRVNEDGAVQTRKEQGGEPQNYPLYKFQHGEGWTKDYLYRATPADLMKKQIIAKRTHINTLRSFIALALLWPLSRTEKDRYRDNLELKIKPLANGDGASLGSGANGEAIDPSHSHYLAAAELDVASLRSLIDTVAEHTSSGNVQVWVSRAQEAAVRGLAGFTAYQDSRVIPAMLAAIAPNALVGAQALNTSNPANRAIGVFESAEIFVKPYMPSNYVVAIDANADTKPLRRRQHDIAALRGLHLGGTSMSHPLEAAYYEDYMGLAVHNRVAAAALYLGGNDYDASALVNLLRATQ